MEANHTVTATTLNTNTTANRDDTCHVSEASLKHREDDDKKDDDDDGNGPQHAHA